MCLYVTFVALLLFACWLFECFVLFTVELLFVGLIVLLFACCLFVIIGLFIVVYLACCVVV